ncbi:class B sortase [Peptostreptococcus equinus]|uniref:Class B sortase n=1 Tax=Peptostreptococcus equinus TaxID=3003601 RepID=A0ABY7JPT2_9FIRM|nr:class B sortase [Peptostreptococcus sp. CBA3647]WAW15372.1 class B sortase [Peptostreptococcus sp. CBA3647]
MIFLFSGYKLLSIKINEKKENNKFQDLRSKIELRESEKKGEDNNASLYGKYQNIYKENNDFVGWLKIPNTKIDYPVMSTPNDPNYYLRRNFEKENSISGTPYIGEGIDVNSKSFIIYSHNMKNHTMFGTLEKYKDIEYRNSNNLIEFDTFGGQRLYEIIAAYHIDLDKQHFKYYNYYGDWSEERFNDFVENISKISIYGKVEDVSYTDQIIQLSTCSYFTDDGRFVIVAKRIN